MEEDKNDYSLYLDNWYIDIKFWPFINLDDMEELKWKELSYLIEKKL